MDQNNSMSISSTRSLDVGAALFAVVGTNRSVLNAASWLKKVGASLIGCMSPEEARGLNPAPLAILVSGDTHPQKSASTEKGPTEIYLWDFEVGRPGVGAFACSVSGVSSVIGKVDAAPGLLPAHVPEKWAGTFGANLALSLLFSQTMGTGQLPRRIDVSAADILRAFAEQNSGNHAGVPYGWRRNGRTAVEHGGVFPQGFFPCKDGFVAVQARSKQDWRAIMMAFGNPQWADDPEFQDPFKLSEDDSRILPIFGKELLKRNRRELLDIAIKTGAPMAPVLSPEEAVSWQNFRPGYLDATGKPDVPYTVSRYSIVTKKMEQTL